jgi:RimJ/RimL family protein N-acetyltransferase
VGRLTYRPMAAEDLDDFADFLADEACVRYLINSEIRSRAEASDALERWIAVGMEALLDGGETVGWAGYVDRNLAWGDEVELGWLIRRAHWGRGYASEAAMALRERGPERVIHLIHPANAASIAVACKLGATHERDTELRGGPVAVYVSTRPSEPGSLFEPGS